MVGNNESLQRCLDSGYRYLSYRPRSEAEIRQRLKRRGFDSKVVEEAIAKLKEQNLIDDVAFAQFWKSNRLSFKPRSKRLIVKELKSKKIAPEVIEQVTQDINDEANAYKLGSSRMHTLGELNYSDFQRRLSSYLSYRGFSYAVIRQTLSRLWERKKQISNQISL
jgi:regulatory protein